MRARGAWVAMGRTCGLSPEGGDERLQRPRAGDPETDGPAARESDVSELRRETDVGGGGLDASSTLLGACSHGALAPKTDSRTAQASDEPQIVAFSLNSQRVHRGQVNHTYLNELNSLRLRILRVIPSLHPKYFR
jgi:hypothetical protein